MSTTTGSKRKRDTDLPRVVFQAEDRCWERILKEDSLDELTQVVAKRLALAPGSIVKMWRITDGRRFELFEEDDFDAFYVALFQQNAMQVEIKVIDTPEHDPSSFMPPNDIGVAQSNEIPESASTRPSKKRKVARANRDEVSTPRVEPTPNAEIAEEHTEVAVVDDHIPEPEAKPPTKKKRKKKAQIVQEPVDEGSAFTDTLAEALTEAAHASPTEPGPSEPRPQMEAVPQPKKRRNPRKSVPEASPQPPPENDAMTSTSPVEEQASVSLAEHNQEDEPAPPKKKRKKSRVPASDTESEDQPSSRGSRPKRQSQMLKERLLQAGYNEAQPEEQQHLQESKKSKRRKGQSQHENVPEETALETNEYTHSLPSSTTDLSVEPHPARQKSRKKQKAETSSCPICEEIPLHQRYDCPVILAGRDAVQDRIEQLSVQGERGLVTELTVILSNMPQPDDSQPTSVMTAVPDDSADREDVPPSNDNRKADSLNDRPSSPSTPVQRRSVRPIFPDDDEGSSEEEFGHVPTTRRKAPPLIAITSSSAAPPSPGVPSARAPNKVASPVPAAAPTAKDNTANAVHQEDLDPALERTIDDVPMASPADTQHPHSDQGMVTGKLPSKETPSQPRNVSVPPTTPPSLVTPPAPQRNSRLAKGRVSLSELTSRALTQFQPTTEGAETNSPFAITMPLPDVNGGRQSAHAFRVDQKEEGSSASADDPQPLSLSQWTVLAGSDALSENGDTLSTGQLDELLPSSSPDIRQGTRRLPRSPGPSFPEGTPLFLPSTQPLSQRSERLTNTTASKSLVPHIMAYRLAKASETAFGEEDEVERSIKSSQDSQTPHRAMMFPSLSQLKGRAFSSPQLLVGTPPQSTPADTDGELDEYGRKKIDAESDSSDSDDEGQAEKEVSHIPKSRRAGNGRKTASKISRLK